MFEGVKVDDQVTCVLGETRFRLHITGLTPFTIVCGEWVFDREVGSCISNESPFHLGSCCLQEPH